MIQMALEISHLENQLQEMYNLSTARYECSCGKQYKGVGHLKNHLKNIHGWNFTSKKLSDDLDTDYVALWRASFMKCALLLRDTYNAYRMADGNRIFRNAKFEMLCAHVAHHSKYQLWLWRLIAYEMAVLSPKEAYEYKWNCTTNLRGHVGQNIPNDNLVELMVKAVKDKLKKQGANMTYESARKAVKSLQMQEDILLKFQQESQFKPKGTTRSTPEMKGEIKKIVSELRLGKIFKHIAGRKLQSFGQFKDVYCNVDMVKLHKWIEQQKIEILL
jgi:hypothetical protein